MNSICRQLFLALAAVMTICSLACNSDPMEDANPVLPRTVKLHGSGYEDQARDILQQGNEYWILGDTRSATQGTRILPYLIKTDLEGNEIITEVLDLFPSENADVQAREFHFVSEEIGIVLVGDIKAEGEKADYFVALLDLDFFPIWAERYGEAAFEERASAIVVEDDFAYVLGTTTRIDSIKPKGPAGVLDSSDVFLSKIDLFAPEAPLFYKSYGYTGIDIGSDLVLLPDGNLLATATTDFPENASQDQDLLLIRFNQEGNPIQLAVAGEPGIDEVVTSADLITTAEGELRLGLAGYVLRSGESFPLPMITLVDPFDLFVYGIFDADNLGLGDLGGDLLRGRFNSIAPQDDGVLAITGARIERDAEFSDLILIEFFMSGDALEVGFGTTHGSFVGNDEGRSIVSDGDRVAILGSLNYAQSPTMIFIGYDLPY